MIDIKPKGSWPINLHKQRIVLENAFSAFPDLLYKGQTSSIRHLSGHSIYAEVDQNRLPDKAPKRV